MEVPGAHWDIHFHLQHVLYDTTGFRSKMQTYTNHDCRRDGPRHGRRDSRLDGPCDGRLEGPRDSRRDGRRDSRRDDRCNSHRDDRIDLKILRSRERDAI